LGGKSRVERGGGEGRRRKGKEGRGWTSPMPEFLRAPMTLFKSATFTEFTV